MDPNKLADERVTVPRQGLGIAHGEYILQQLIGLLDVDMVFDVGANVGQYASQLRDKVGYRGPIVSFEPIPAAAARLRALAAQDSEWQLRECAIGDRRGRAEFNVMAGDQFSSLLKPSPRFEGHFHGQHKVQSVIDIEIITLGDALADAPPFSRGLLKLDTQGSEMQILRAGAEHLSRFPAIQIEVAFQNIYAGAESFSVTKEALESWGYRLCALFPNNPWDFPHLVEMDAIFLRPEFLPALP
jgi:FkbM family methyltransferase